MNEQQPNTTKSKECMLLRTREPSYCVRKMELLALEPVVLCAKIRLKCLAAAWGIVGSSLSSAVIIADKAIVQQQLVVEVTLGSPTGSRSADRCMAASSNKARVR